MLEAYLAKPFAQSTWRGSTATLKLLLDGKGGEELEPAIIDGVSDFLRIRDTHLLYR